MSNWPSAKAKRVMSALQSIGWRIKRQSGSHRTLEHDDYPDYVFAFHDGEEIGPRMLARIAKKLVLNQAICEAGEDSANNAIHLSRCCKAIFFAVCGLRPGVGSASSTQYRMKRSRISLPNVRVKRSVSFT